MAGNKMAADYVWLSTVMTDPGRLRPFTNDLLEKAKPESREVESYKRNDAGEPLGPDQFPAIIWGPPTEVREHSCDLRLAPPPLTTQSGHQDAFAERNVMEYRHRL
jgi:hypothetical protein